MPLNAQEQELLDWAVSSLPRWFTSDERVREDIYAKAKLFGLTRGQVEYWASQTRILTANGAEPGLPDWLNQHAMDRGSRRQLGELDPALRDRLRNIDDALTRASLIAAAQSIVDVQGIIGTVGMVELPRDAAHFGKYSAVGGTGGAFTKAGNVVTFTPGSAWSAQPWRDFSIPKMRRYQLQIAGAAAGNNGTFAITGLDGGDGALYTNASGVAETSPTSTWTLRRLDVNGRLTDGYARSYFRRGYRMGRSRPGAIVMILPFGSTPATVAAVLEMLRQKKAAGFQTLVERRLTPTP